MGSLLERCAPYMLIIRKWLDEYWNLYRALDVVVFFCVFFAFEAHVRLYLVKIALQMF